MRPLVLSLLLLVSAGTGASADVLVLASGGEIRVANWWYEGERLVYETDAGLIAIPRSEVVEIRAQADDDEVPRMRADPGEENERPADAGSSEKDASGEPERPRPSLPASAELDSAIETTRIQLRREGRDEVRERLARRLADLNVLRARRHVADGEPDLALNRYEAALDLRPDHPQGLVELAWLELREGRSHRAETLARNALAIEGARGHGYEILGEIAYRNNRLSDALDNLRNAALARPGDDSLERKMAKIERERAAEGSFRRADSQHFVLRFDGERDDRAGDMMLDLLEESIDDLSRELDTYVREPVTVILYTREEFHETTQTPREVAGLFDGKIRLPVGGVERISPALRRVTRHELVHALLHVKGRGQVPRWLHEGLAQLLEPRTAAGVDPAIGLALRRGGVPGIEPFSYPTALSFVSYLDGEYGRARVLWLVSLLAERRPENDAFREAFGSPREEIVAEWGQSLKKRASR